MIGWILLYLFCGVLYALFFWKVEGKKSYKQHMEQAKLFKVTDRPSDSKSEEAKADNEIKKFILAVLFWPIWLFISLIIILIFIPFYLWDLLIITLKMILGR